MQALNGSVFAGGPLTIELDSSNASKLRISGLCPGIQWQQVKDHFAQFGSVCFCEVHPADGATAQQTPGAGAGPGAYGGGAVGGKGMGGMSKMMPKNAMQM